MAIEILRRERAALQRQARQLNSRHLSDGKISIRSLNALRRCATLTVAILTLKQLGF